MRIKTGAVAQGRSADVELDSLDGENNFPSWSQWGTPKQFKMLSALADYMLVEYMEDANMLASMHAQTRKEQLLKILAEK